MKNWGVQEILSVGYVYLFLLGIVTDAIYYNMNGINIIAYSNLSDVLLSPLVLATSRIILPIVIGGCLFLFFLYYRFVMPRLQNQAQNTSSWLVRAEGVLYLFGCLLLGIFIGLAVGRGGKLQESIAKGKLEPNHLLTYTDAKTQEVHLVGQNSVYLFYVPKAGKTIVVAQIANSIKHIQKIEPSTKTGKK